jgi:hypothetical protein
MGDSSTKLNPSFFQTQLTHVLDRFDSAERQKIGVHTCPGWRSRFNA